MATVLIWILPGYPSVPRGIPFLPRNGLLKVDTATIQELQVEDCHDLADCIADINKAQLQTLRVAYKLLRRFKEQDGENESILRSTLPHSSQFSSVHLQSATLEESLFWHESIYNALSQKLPSLRRSLSVVKQARNKPSLDAAPVQSVEQLEVWREIKVLWFFFIDNDVNHCKFCFRSVPTHLH